MTGPFPLRASIPIDGTTTCGRKPIGGTEPCGKPGEWHIQWGPGPDASGSFACAEHMERIRAHFVYLDRHQVGPDCNMPGAIWTTGRCRVPATTS